jgi:hypothetical protein
MVSKVSSDDPSPKSTGMQVGIVKITVVGDNGSHTSLSSMRTIVYVPGAMGGN